METQKISNLLNSFEMNVQNLQQKNGTLLTVNQKGNYSHGKPIKFLTSSLKSSLCDYSDADVLVTGNIAVVGADDNTKVAIKNRAPFRKCKTEANDTYDEAEHINIAMPMYNLIKYNDNYSDTSGSLWQFKRDETEETVDAEHIPNSYSSFKYKSSLITDRNGVKIAVPLKYLINFRRSLEMPLVSLQLS